MVSQEILEKELDRQIKARELRRAKIQVERTLKLPPTEETKYYKAQQAARKNARFVQQQKGFSAYAQSKSGAVSRGISSVFNFLQSPTRALYRKSIQVSPASNRGYGKVGRPKGSLDRRYAAYGGVYGYRKFLAQQNRLNRIKAQQQASMSPEETQAIARFRMSQQAQMQNPENRVVPDTSGKIDMARFWKEIDDAAGLVD